MPGNKEIVDKLLEPSALDPDPTPAAGGQA